MKPGRFIVLFVLLAPLLAIAQQPEVKFIADTLVVQAEGKYETDPDLAIMTFDVSSQEKELKEAYAKASQSMRTIVEVAARNGLGKDAIQTGELTACRAMLFCESRTLLRLAPSWMSQCRTESPTSAR
jgi:uncharacterized protein YggE